MNREEEEALDLLLRLNPGRVDVAPDRLLEAIDEEILELVSEDHDSDPEFYSHGL